MCGSSAPPPMAFDVPSSIGYSGGPNASRRSDITPAAFGVESERRGILGKLAASRTGSSVGDGVCSVMASDIRDSWCQLFLAARNWWQSQSVTAYRSFEEREPSPVLAAHRALHADIAWPAVCVTSWCMNLLWGCCTSLDCDVLSLLGALGYSACSLRFPEAAESEILAMGVAHSGEGKRCYSAGSWPERRQNPRDSLGFLRRVDAARAGW